MTGRDFNAAWKASNVYLKTQASQDMRRKANAVFVLVPRETPNRIAGYFTLCAYGLAPAPFPNRPASTFRATPW